jgi:hypothetical protein
MSNLQTPLEMMLIEIERCMDAKLYLAALMMTAALPDICGAMESEDCRAKQSRYESWFNDNIGSAFNHFGAQQCYSLRCGLLHQGRSEFRTKSQNGRFAFLLPGGIEIGMGKAKQNDNTFMMIKDFVSIFVSKTRQWESKNKQNPIVTKNIQSLVSKKRELPPNIRGIDLIA